jgi:ubiquinone/menaquinone biosynthesis C-methylase UbiE
MTSEPVRNFDRVADIYDESRGWPSDVSTQIGAGLYALLAPFAQGKRLRVVEVGAGTGRVLGPLAAHPVWAVGVDVSAGMLARLREKVATNGRAGSAYPVLGDVRQLPLADGQFDAGLFVHILHLVQPWQAVLAEVRRVVRPGGAFAFGLDERQPGETDWIDERWDALIHYDEGTHPGHISMANTAADVLTAEGYTVRQHTLAHWTYFRTPAYLLHYRRERWYSASWRLPDAVLLPAVAQLEADLLARYGRLDIPLPFTSDFHVLLAHRQE